MTEYQPGTVATLTIHGEQVRAILRGDEWLIVGHSFFKSVAVGNATLIQSVRPLVVLDPTPLYEDGETFVHPSEFARTLRLVADADGGTYRARIVRGAAEQIEAQTKPTRIPEPTTPLSEVEASTRGRERRRFVRGIHSEARWIDGVSGWGWCELIDPVLVRDGIEDAS